MCVPPQDLNGMLLRNYQALPLMQQNACRQCSVNGNRPMYQQSGISLISNSPNPFVSSTTVTYTTQGMHTMVQVMNTSGKVIKTLVDKAMKPGTYTVSFDSINYPAGTYYLRLQNMELGQVKAMMIVKE
jgi:ABC-type xylose transport system substrate-binding protein